MRSCFECGATESLHDHHVVPRSRGGTKTVPLCHACHARAHGRTGNYDIGSLTSAALQRKKARGEKTGGAVPYGYALADDGVRLIENEGEQKAIALIRACRADGLSIRAIAERLGREGMKPRGKAWNKSTVHRILQR